MEQAKPIFRPTGPARTKVLTWQDFIAGQQTANVASVAAYYDVPLGHAAVLLAQKPIRAFLKSRFNEPFAADAAATRVINLGGAGLQMVQSTRSAPALPANNHPDVLAYISNDNGVTLTRANVTAINFATGQVTVAKLATTNYIAVYYLSANGELEIKAYRPVGGDTVAGRLFNKPLRGLAEIDQSNERSAMVLNLSKDTALPSQFRLALEVRSSGVISWDALAEHDLAILTKIAPIEIFDLQALNVEAERGLRGGNF